MATFAGSSRVSSQNGRAPRLRHVEPFRLEVVSLTMSKIGHRFRSACDRLEAFKGVFAIFPSENMYTSVLCSSLSLIVSAAVNHDDIAELLSEAVADIADKAARAAKVMLIYPRNSTLRRLFARLYAQIFLFYRDAIEWYMESKIARAFKSLDARLKDRYEKAKARIDDCLNDIHQVAGVAHIAQTYLSGASLAEQMTRMQETILDAFDQRLAGEAAQRTLRAMVESVVIETSLKHDSPALRIRDTVLQDRGDDSGDLMARADAKDKCSVLQQFIIGTEGSALLSDGHLWLPDVHVSFQLGEWISPSTECTTLWISSPNTDQEFPSSRAAAVIAAIAAWESRLPVISHFCDLPHSADVPEGSTVEETGLIGLVYSLVVQLLKFNVRDDMFKVSKEQMTKLDGSHGSWQHALLLLKDLLRTTPQLQRCVIDGLNDLCFSDGEKWCSELLETLFDHQRASEKNFKILLTTVGQSRVLPDFVGWEDQVEVEGGARELIHGNEWPDARYA